MLIVIASVFRPPEAVARFDLNGLVRSAIMYRRPASKWFQEHG
jgi:hypothetical protein